jgi:hypothetical protein
MLRLLGYCLQLVITLAIFGFSCFLTSWNASYLMIEDDWRERTVFTAKIATSPQQIAAQINLSTQLRLIHFYLVSC